MQTLLRKQKPICLIVLISFYWIFMPQLPAQAAMVTTEDTTDRDSKSDFDRARIKAFVSRDDVIAQLQSYGISCEEAMARVDSLTDQEIALIEAKLDQLPAGGDFWLTFLFTTPVGIGIVIFSCIVVFLLHDWQGVLMR